jgi:hypothetical protein
MRRPRRAGTLAAMNQRVFLTMTAAAGLCLLAAACGRPSASGPGASSGGGGTASTSGVAYAQCMRSHGVPDYPGPGSSGQLPKVASGQQVGVSDSRLTAAQGACQALWPYQAPTQAQQRQELADDLKFAQCMRSHGLPDLPDPTDSGGSVEFVISVSRDGINPQSPRVLAKARECQRALPAGSPLPSATLVP